MSGFTLDLRSETLDDTFFDMSLEELADIEITSVAKKPQKISFAASSVFVVSQQDIKRSGVTTIPDALRMVPGVQVAKLDSNKWAISIRGFNDIFSNKLLILIDGRTVYSPFFGGARWDTVDTILQDIDRIEVVRGPGGTLWGANAVNGVINIITKKAKDSAGLLVSALAGNEERGQLSIRYGGEINADTQYRVYAKGFEKDAAENGVDDWRVGRVGFRMDSEPSKLDKLTIQTEVYAGEEGERAISNVTSPPFATFASKAEVFGSHVLFRWDRDLEDDANLTLQAYYDRTEREHFYVSEKRDTVDIDFQHRLHSFWKQEFVWGLGFRYIGDETAAGTLMALSPEERSDQIYSAFIQDEISIIDEKLILTVGSKVEHNSYTGFEYQPSARLLWKPHDNHSVWGAISRAVRVPSRMEQDAFLQRSQIAPGVVLALLGSRKMDAEELTAYELGYRFLEKQFSFDLSVFYNKYQNLRSVERSATAIPGFVPLVVGNELYGETYGIELASSWTVNENWRLHGSYSFIQMQLHKEASSADTTEEADEGDTPHHQFNLRSLWQVTEDWQLDATVRYVGMVKEASTAGKGAVDAYVTVDLRLAWHAHKALELSVIGQNLLGKHREFRGSTVDTQATDVEPSVFLQMDWLI
ncbi:MAG: TonB-dependent receptor [Methylococcaceae bacterium]|nr:TonB-dependent receptor [Methylococcaceae bacterium]